MQPDALEEIKQEALKIIKEKAVLKGEFILSSGQKSNFYIDIKRITLDGKFLDIITEIISDYVAKNFKTRNFAGIELGSVPIVAATILKMKQKGYNSKGVIVRKELKKYGTSREIEGSEDIGSAILIEDVITTGKTTADAIDKLLRNNIKIEGVITIIDRGGGENIKSKVDKFFSLFEARNVLEDSEPKI